MNDERGSIAPLGIGFALVTLSALLTATASTSVFLFQRRLAAEADAVALAVGQEVLVAAGTPTSDRLAAIASARLEQIGSTAQLASIEIADALTLELTLCERWQSPVPNPFGSSQQIVCASSKARAVG